LFRMGADPQSCSSFIENRPNSSCHTHETTWSVIKTMRRAQDHMKSDERILGDGDFTQSVLDEAKERIAERCRLQAQGYDLEKVRRRVSSELTP